MQEHTCIRACCCADRRAVTAPLTSAAAVRSALTAAARGL
jgi:hypothetical protein